MDHVIAFLKSGILQFSWVGMVVATLVMTHVTIAAVTIYLHRSQAHRALDLHPVVSHFFRFWLWLSTGMKTKAWVAIHRKHHARCETEDDPHSPNVLGINRVLWYGAELYKIAAKDKGLLEKYGCGTPDDWAEKNIYTRLHSQGILYMLAADIVLFGLPGIIIWAAQMMWIPFFAAGVINGLGHYIGYRNFECHDAATNLFPWGILIGGEELHNNHHTYGTSAKLSVKWWEFDIGWLYIRTMEILGLAKVRRVAAKTALAPGKTEVDGETLKAILANRFQVLADYSADVISPVFNSDGRGLARRIKTLLIRDTALVGAKDEKRLTEALESRESLNTVYQFRMKLLALWASSTASQKELVDEIANWCVEAERSGVEALRAFAQKLKTFVPVSAN